MAEIVLGMGTSHGPMLVTTPDIWPLRIPDDRKNRHPWRGHDWSFDELVDARKPENLAAQILPYVLQAKYEQCGRAIGKMADLFRAARPDVTVIIGNDQMEIFNEDLVPAFSVLYGAEISNGPMNAQRLASLPPGIKETVPGYIPEGGAMYQAVSELGLKIIEHVMMDGFDVAAMKRFPKGETPHAYGFVYRHIMRDDPTPSVPVVLNTFYPPNQPTLRRCHDFGKSIMHAIQSWQSDAKVALIASGGLTHFVIDEPTDRIILDAMRDGSIERIEALGEHIFQAGTSEIKNWIPVAGAMADLQFAMTVVDYVPVYRTEAGTGNAMGFVAWTKPGNS
jgi:hypothetical protein